MHTSGYSKEVFCIVFRALGEPSTFSTFPDPSALLEVRNFHDVTYTKAKRVQWTEWVPDTATTPSPMLVPGARGSGRT